MKSTKPYEACADKIILSSEYDLSKLKEFVEKQVIPKAMLNDEKHEFDLETTLELYKLGLLNVVSPKRFGGQDHPVRNLISITCELAYGSVGVAATFIANTLGYSPFVLYGNELLLETISREFEKSFKLWSFAVTEKGCGSDLEKTATVACRVPGGFEIEGEKNFITNSKFCTDLCVLANVISENGQKEGLSFFYVPGNTPGLVRGDSVKKIGWRESNTAHLKFEKVFVKDQYLIGRVGEGLKIFSECLSRSKTLMAAMSIGLSYRALDLAQERLGGVERFGKPLIEQSAIRHLLARLHTKVEASWLMTARSAATWDQFGQAIKESSMAKLMAGQTAMEVASQVAELFGARGYLMEYEVSRIFRDAKAMEIVEGPSLVQELIISKQVLPRKNSRAKDKSEVSRSKINQGSFAA